MWDYILAILIIVSLVLVIWAKVSHMTIPELIGEIKEIIWGTAEEKTEEVISYYE